MRRTRWRSPLRTWRPCQNLQGVFGVACHQLHQRARHWVGVKAAVLPVTQRPDRHVEHRGKGVLAQAELGARLPQAAGQLSTGELLVGHGRVVGIGFGRREDLFLGQSIEACPFLGRPFEAFEFGQGLADDRHRGSAQAAQ